MLITNLQFGYTLSLTDMMQVKATEEQIVVANKAASDARAKLELNLPYRFTFGCKLSAYCQELLERANKLLPEGCGFHFEKFYLEEADILGGMSDLAPKLRFPDTYTTDPSGNDGMYANDFDPILPLWNDYEPPVQKSLPKMEIDTEKRRRFNIPSMGPVVILCEVHTLRRLRSMSSHITNQSMTALTLSDIRLADQKLREALDFYLSMREGKDGDVDRGAIIAQANDKLAKHGLEITEAAIVVSFE